MSATLTAPRKTDAREAQARRALRLANQTRIEKANVKRDLRDGTLTLPEVVAQRPEPLRSMPLFALVLELPGFGQWRLDKLGRAAAADGINLARTLGSASTHTLDWLVRTVNGLSEDEATTGRTEIIVAAPTAAAEDDPARRGAPRHRLLHGVAGYYQTDRETRRVVLSAADGTPVLFDRGCDDERVIEQFESTAGLLEVAAVASGYLDEARRLRRPVVTAGKRTAAPFVEAQAGGRAG